MRRATVTRLVGAALLAALTGAPAGAQEVVYQGSLQLASGDYIFTERTSSLFLFNGLGLGAGPLQLSASVPLIYQSTPWISYSGGGVVPSGGTQHSDVHGRLGGGRMGHSSVDDIALADTTTFDEIGLGDPLLHAGLRVSAGAGLLPGVSVTGDLKVPLADVDRGFGTGAWDFAAGVSLSESLGPALLFADVSYWVLGDLPELELKDPVAYSFGLGAPLAGGKLGLLASYLGYTEILEDVDPPSQLSLGLSILLPAGRSVIASAGMGLSDSSPDLTLSFGWRMPL